MDCKECGMDLLTTLTDKGYSKDILDAASKLTEMISREEGSDVSDNYPDKEDDSTEGVVDSPAEDDSEKVDPKEMRDMPLAEHKAMLKKKKVITISVE